MGKRNKVTTRDIAEYTHVSQTTVSMILSGKSTVSFREETVDLVKEAAKKLHYKKPEVKTRTTQKKKLLDTLIVFCPNVTNAYYSVIISSICKRAKYYHYHVFCLSTLRESSLEKEYLHYLKAIQPTGIIFLYPPASQNIPMINEMSKSTIVIEIGDKPNDIIFDTIELNSIKSGYLVGKHLLEQGHTHIAYLSSPISEKEVGRNDRYEGIKKAFSTKKNTVVESFTSSLNNFMEYPLENQEYINGYNLCQKILESPHSYTAFVGNNDMTAIGIIAAIKDNGYHVPKDYAVCGFDNIPLASSPMISLTSIEHASNEKGSEAVDLIFNKKKESSRSRKKIRLEYEPQLIIRGSSQKINRQKG